MRSEKIDNNKSEDWFYERLFYDEEPALPAPEPPLPDEAEATPHLETEQVARLAEDSLEDRPDK